MTSRDGPTLVPQALDPLSPASSNHLHHGPHVKGHLEPRVLTSQGHMRPGEGAGDTETKHGCCSQHWPSPLHLPLPESPHLPTSQPRLAFTPSTLIKNRTRLEYLLHL